MLGQVLQKAIKDAGLPLEQVATHMGISETNLYRLFKKDSFEVSYLQRAASLLQLPISYFLEEAEDFSTITQTGTANQAHGSGNVQKIKLGSKAPAPELALKLNTCIIERDSFKQQLSLANALIASQTETITLLRGSYNRPN